MRENSQRTTEQLEHQHSESSAIPETPKTAVIIRALKWIAKTCLAVLIWLVKRPSTWRFVMVHVPALIDGIQKRFDDLFG